MESLILPDTFKVCIGPKDQTALSPLEDLSKYESQEGRFAADITRYFVKFTEFQKQNEYLKLVATAFANELRSKTGGKLLPPQITCLISLLSILNGRAILALPMGFGKTVVSCAALKFYAGPALILTPKNKLTDWERHILLWAYDRITKVVILETSKEVERFFKIAPPESLNTYAICMSHGLSSRKNNVEILKKIRWRTVIVDEAHEMKNSKTNRAQALYEYTKRCRSCILVTGTPVTKRGSDLYSLVRALHPEAFGNYYRFSERYFHGKKDPYLGVWKEFKRQRLRELLSVIFTVMIRSDAESQADMRKCMPPYERRSVQLPNPSDEYVTRYRMIMKREALLRERASNMKLPKKARIQAEKMRKLLTHEAFMMTSKEKIPHIVDYVGKEVYPKVCAKRRALVIFCKYRKSCDEIQRLLLERYSIQSLVVTGSTDGLERQAIIEPVVLGTSEIRVLILTIKASAQGIELCPGVTDIIFAEMDYTPSTMNQAEGRAYRLGAVDPITCHWLMMKPSYDEIVMSILHTAELVSDELVENATTVNSAR